MRKRRYIGSKTLKALTAVYEAFEGLPIDDEINACERVQIAKDSVALHTLSEANCNGELSKYQESRERAIMERFKSFEQRHASNDYTFLFDGDPRGYVVKVVRRDGRFNSYGGPEHGMGIY